MDKQSYPGLLPENSEELLRTRYREDLGIWVCRWSGILNSSHFRSCYWRIFHNATAYQCRYWLLDIRSRGKAEPEDFDWYFTVYVPELVGALQGPSYLAYLVTPSHYNFIRQTDIFNKFDELARTTFLKTHFFQSEQEAIDWLMLSRKQ